MLESTDVALEVPHPCSMWPEAGCGVRRGCLRVGPRLRFFFFFSQIRANAAQFVRIGFDSCRTGLIRQKSGRISRLPIRPKQTGNG